jgi:uncharacterized protein YndB with AHSA1/START domain
MAGRPSVKVEATLAASAEALFQGFTDPELLQQWFMLDWGEECEVHAVPGGKWSLKGESPTGKKVMCEGVYEMVDSPKHLRFTFLWHPDPTSPPYPETWYQTMDVTFTPVDGGGGVSDDDGTTHEHEATRVTFTHEEVADAESAESHREAWELGLQMLAEVVGGESAEADLIADFGKLSEMMGGGGGGGQHLAPLSD